MIDRTTDTWKTIAVYANEQIDESLKALEEGTDHDWRHRGRIKAFRNLLALDLELDKRVIEATGDYGFQGPADAE